MTVLLQLWPILSEAAAKHHGVVPNSNEVIRCLASDGNTPIPEVRAWHEGVKLPERTVLERYAGLYLFSRKAIEPLVEASKDYVPGTTLPRDPTFYGAVDYSLNSGDACFQAVRLFCGRCGIESNQTCFQIIKYLITREPQSIEEGLGILILAFPQYSGGAAGVRVAKQDLSENEG